MSVSVKRIMSCLISFVLIVTVFGICEFGNVEKFASAESIGIMLNGFDNDADLSSVNSIHCASKSLCTTDSIGGSGSLYLSFPSSYPSYIDPYHGFFNVEWGTPFQLISPGTFDYVEFCTKNVDNPGLSFGYQLIVMNGNNVGAEYYEGASTANCDWKRHTWETGKGTVFGDTSQINRFRPVILNQNGRYVDVDFLVDGLIVFNSDYYNQRTNAETKIKNDINALPTPNETNAEQVLKSVNAIISSYEGYKTSYYNFYVDNYSKLIEIRNQCQGFFGKSLLVNGFDKPADFNLVSKTPGGNTGSVKFVGEHCSRGGAAFVDVAPNSETIHSYFDVDLSAPVNLNEYSLIEFCLKTNRDFIGENYQLQIRAIDKSINSNAGINFLTRYDSTAGQWKMGRIALNAGTAEEPRTSLSKIDRFRILSVNTSGQSVEMDTYFDSLVLCNERYVQKRADAENDLKGEIDSLGNISQSNFRDIESDLLSLRKKYEAAESEWPGFMPSNANKYIATVYAYDYYANKSSFRNTFFMPTMFADYMLFNQNDTMNIWGTATIGRNLMKAELYKNGALTETVSDYSQWNGNWSLSFSPRQGSYDSYSIKVYENNVLKKTINNIAVGALWYACGQSNMQYQLDWEQNGMNEINNAKDPNMRIMYIPNDPMVDFYGPHPAMPQDDIAGNDWGTFETNARGSRRGEIDAQAYYAAKELRATLNVPVGIINAALGSTNIQTWLSRETIERNSTLKGFLQNSGYYRTIENFTTGTMSFLEMTAMYNCKIAPLYGMNVEGVFWCQGESNIHSSYPQSFYSQALMALNYTFGKTFNNNNIPIIMAQIAAHTYSNDPQSVAKWIEEVLDVTHQYSNIISLPIYDVSLEYNPDTTSIYSNMFVPIHPWVKSIPGYRLGQTALHDIYKVGNADYYSPEVRAYKTMGNNIFVKFSHVGTGLSTLNASIGVHGFTIAGENGIYANAKAQIISKDTIRIWNDAIRNPQNFTYAFNDFSMSCNLCNSYSLPAMPFRSIRNQSNFYNTNDWIYCDTNSVWVSQTNSASYNPTWQGFILNPSNPGTVTIDNATKYGGTGSVKLQYTPDSANLAGVSTMMNYNYQPSTLERFNNISFKVKNNNNRNIGIMVIIGNGSTHWMLSGGASVVVPANSDFTTCTFSLTNHVIWGGGSETAFNNITTLSVLVSDNQSGSINIDEFSFGFETPKTEIIGDTDDDTSVTSVDALLTLQYSVGLVDLNDYQKYISDVNGDDNINVLDALQILQNSLGMCPEFSKYSVIGSKDF